VEYSEGSLDILYLSAVTSTCIKRSNSIPNFKNFLSLHIGCAKYRCSLKMFGIEC
jgi:hypothetical protein